VVSGARLVDRFAGVATEKVTWIIKRASESALPAALFAGHQRNGIPTSNRLIEGGCEMPNSGKCCRHKSRGAGVCRGSQGIPQMTCGRRVLSTRIKGLRGVTSSSKVGNQANHRKENGPNSVHRPRYRNAERISAVFERTFRLGKRFLGGTVEVSRARCV